MTSSIGFNYSGTEVGFVKIDEGNSVAGLVMKGLLEGGDTAPDIAKGFVLFYAPILKNGFEVEGAGSSTFDVSGCSTFLSSKRDFSSVALGAKRDAASPVGANNDIVSVFLGASKRDFGSSALVLSGCAKSDAGFVVVSLGAANRDVDSVGAKSDVGFSSYFLSLD